MLFASLVVTAGVAEAQTFDVVVTPVNPNFLSLSAKDCELGTTNRTISFTFNLPTPVVGTAREKIFLSKTDVCTEDTSTLVILTERDFVTTSGGVETFPPAGVDPLRPNDVFRFLSGSAACNALAPQETTVFACVRITVVTDVGAITHLGRIAVRVDTLPPPIPVGVATEPLDSGLRVSWTMPNGFGDARGFNVYVDGILNATVVGINVLNTDLRGLVNGTTYSVTVSSFDNAGTEPDRFNESAQSAPAAGTPAAAEDFWELYKAQGGQQTNGCAGAGATPLALLALALAVRRRRAPVVVVLLVALIAPARAQQGLTRFNETPRHSTVSLQIGGFSPNVDDEESLTGTPYATIFGESSNILWRAAYEYDLFAGLFGRVSLGVSGGFWQAVGKGLVPATGAKAADTVLLNLWPVTPAVTWRFDPLVRKGVPVVPYARLGYGFTYFTTSMNGVTSEAAGTSGHGWATGAEVGGGLALVLDPFEPTRAAELDQDFGINTTGIYFDATYVFWSGSSGLLLQGSVLSGGVLVAF